MDGKAVKLVHFLEGHDKRFIIPVYQRNYSWKEENCRQLYDDLIKLIINDRDWTFALPYIQESFSNVGPFSNVNPTTSNWVSAGYGVGGFNVTCTANFDCARVQIWFGKSNPAKNKEAFDFVYQHRQEIENKLGVQLDWQRADSNKSSTIVYELHGVSIANEVDLIRMAKFHAEWSKKICDVILPILKDLYPSVTLT